MTAMMITRWLLNRLNDSTMYSPTQSSVYPKSSPQKKLTPNLMDKSNYVEHYRNLKLYVQSGLVITKIHRVLAFKQSPWLKRYIDFNTHQRSLSNSGFGLLQIDEQQCVW